MLLAAKLEGQSCLGPLKLYPLKLAGGFGVFPAGFQSALVGFFLTMPDSSLLEMEYLFCAIVCWKYVICIFVLRGAGSQLRDCFESQERLWTFGQC